jgi:2-polyprenyl-3-methyl-5-hydroxy-6-metoxy-1,4-benzoquinol methylase
METDWAKEWQDWEKKYRNVFWKALMWMPGVWALTNACKKLLAGVSLRDPRVLGLGSGTGMISLIIAKILQAKKMTLVDSDKKALAVSKKLVKDSGLNIKVNYLDKNILDLDLNEKFDIVHSEGLVEHFYGRNREKALKKHVDFCQENGYLLIFVPIKGIQYNILKWFLTLLGRWVYDEEPFTKEGLRRLCQKLNLKIVKEETFPWMHEIGLLMKRK